MNDHSPQAVSEQAVLKALSMVNDPDLKRPLTELGMIDKLTVCGGNVRFDLKLTTTACPLKEKIREDAIAAVRGVPGVEAVTVDISKETVTLQARVPERAVVPGIKNIIAVSSGKGGVGKSTVSTNLACAIAQIGAQSGARVGILDADIYGPNVPLLMGLRHQKLTQSEDGRLLPPESYGVKVMSMAFLIEESQPVVWRGPLLDKIIRQFLNDTAWGELDYLIIDLPPGTGDAQLTIVQAVPVVGAIIVTTPQDVALHDSKKGLAMFTNTNIPVFGIVENMSYYICGHCHQQDNIFGHGGGEEAAKTLGIPFLGSIPLVARLREDADRGVPAVIGDPDSEPAKVFREIAHQVIAKICARGLNVVGDAAENTPLVPA